MRHMLVTSVACLAAAWALIALPAGVEAKTPLTVTKVRADWIGSSHRIFVDLAWTPKSLATRITVKISVNGTKLRTLQVKHWVIGRKLFKLTVPTTVVGGSKARIEVRASSAAGEDHRTVTLDLPYA
ncbi:MAG: hypothetical protein QOI71_444 [Gaiellales bacterium]|nr:hypothetical protein [Gaiellales bacterium]